MHSIFKNHEHIAWDFDETLINGPKSAFWRSCVLNLKDKKHSIITFRSNDGAAHIIKELPKIGLSIDMFDKIYNCPDDLSKKYMSTHKELRYVFDKMHLTPKLERTVKCTNFTLDEIIKINNDFLGWKPRICKEIGATILIDDQEKMLKDHCKKEGIVFVNALKGLKPEIER